MQGIKLERNLKKAVRDGLESFPAVAIIGPRQAGKSTLAKEILRSFDNSLYLDLERPSHLRMLENSELFLSENRDRLVCLDEIQRKPELFPLMRSIVDEEEHNGRFLILGSASPELLRQSSESLAGRIIYFELTPFLFSEVSGTDSNLLNYLLRGGFPRSFLAKTDDKSMQWRESFLVTFLERDISQLGIGIPPGTLRRLWTMCAHLHGTQLNQSKIGQSMGISHTTVRSYLEVLSRTFMIRLLPPALPNIRKRLIKSPKLYVRDSGILHTLLDIETIEDLMGHPVFGASWEGMVIENILGSIGRRWTASYYRTAMGAEIDLVLEKGTRRIGIECKVSSAPEVQRGFWNSLEDLNIKEAYVVAPVKEKYRIHENVEVISLPEVIRELESSF